MNTFNTLHVGKSAEVSDTHIFERKLPFRYQKVHEIAGNISSPPGKQQSAESVFIVYHC